MTGLSQVSFQDKYRERRQTLANSILDGDI